MQEAAFGVKTKNKSILRSCENINTILRARKIPNFDKIKLLKIQGQIGQTLQVSETSSQSGESLIGNFGEPIFKSLLNFSFPIGFESRRLLMESKLELRAL